MANIYDFTVKNNAGGDVSLEAYKGKALLVVNTATGCGFTPQYKGLEDLYLKYKDRGFEILDFPCNQFGNQAPGNDGEIQQFCTLKYNTTFPRFSKIEVNGKNENPLYTWLKKEKKGGLMGSGIKWNFTKFLIAKDGHVIKRYAPTVTPEALDADVLEALL
jgi:glutathione peroxidase